MLGKAFRFLKSILLLPREINQLKFLLYSVVEMNQKLILEAYKKSDSFDNKGFRVNSQFEEDGLLLYVFSKIGFSNRKGAEFCCGDGKECILANFVLYHGFYALLVDGDDKNIQAANEYFESHPNTLLTKPIVKKYWVTKDNINNILSENGFTGEIDLLSIDLDGLQYHIFNEVNAINARVIVFESNNALPKDLSITIPYDESFYMYSGKYDPEFRSVSHKATVKLMKSKGYKLIGSHRHGFNLIFLRNDIAPELFPEVDYERYYETFHSKNRQQAWEKVKDLPWVKV
jgi:hypothetical protein